MRSSLTLVPSGIGAAILFSAIIGVANLIWLAIDQQPQPVLDPYIEAIWNLTRGYGEKEVWEFPRLMIWSGLAPRVPLYQILSSPFVAVLGFDVDSILALNTLFMLVLGVATYRIAQRIVNSRFAVLATVLVVTLPIVTELSRLVRPHALMPAVVALVLWQCLRTIEQASVKNAWMLAIAVFSAFCIHASSIYLIAVPIASVFIYVGEKIAPPDTSVIARFIFAIKHPVFSKGVIPGFLTITLMIVIWMIIQWDFYVDMQQVIREIFEPQAVQWQLEQRSFANLNVLNTVLLVISAVLVLIDRSKNPTSAMARLMLFWLLSMFIAFHLFLKIGYWQQFSGSVSLIAVMCAKGLSLIATAKNKIVGRVFLLIVVLATVQSYATTAWGVFTVEGLPCGSKNPACEDGLTDLRSNRPLRKEWPIADIIAPLFSQGSCSKAMQCTVTLVSFRSQYFSHELFQHTLVREFDYISRTGEHPFYPTRNVFFSRVGEGGEGILNWLYSDYVYYLLNAKRQPFASKLIDYGAVELEVPIVHFIESQVSQTNGLFKKIVEVPLPNGLYAIVAKRVEAVHSIDDVLDGMKLKDHIRQRMLQSIQ